MSAVETVEMNANGRMRLLGRYLAAFLRETDGVTASESAMMGTAAAIVMATFGAMWNSPLMLAMATGDPLGSVY